jgi:hypothetical protein
MQKWQSDEWDFGKSVAFAMRVEHRWLCLMSWIAGYCKMLSSDALHAICAKTRWEEAAKEEPSRKNWD